ncbi:MAG: DUF2846 domain-containing protein [Deltaproteobacteria bacterium]|nr:DUF2846 domain-containing protein [Deltaproteobacteria bacterium]
MRQLMIRIAVFLVGVVLISGCAPTLGLTFKKIDKVPERMGLVYIYRPSSFVGGGVSYDVKVGETVITTLYNGGYYPYFAKPGELELWARTEAKSAVTLDVKAGEIYYVKGTVGVGFFVGRPHLIVVPKSVGETEIAECQLIPETKVEEKTTEPSP